MKKTFVMRGQTASGQTEILEFGGKQKETKGMAYRLVEFQLYPSTDLATDFELTACITAGKVALDPQSTDFNNEGLIGSIITKGAAATNYDITSLNVINDTFMITQNLLLTVFATAGGGAINWQCRFEAVKMTDAEEAATNFKQYSIFDE